MLHWYSNKKVFTVALMALMVLGAFLRLSHFGEWLHFELDQARDVKVIDAAIDGGVGQLPLLGPRAGGTFLRLGPGFYYLQYASAKVFGSGPVGSAMIIPILSILSIFIFYLFARRIFDEWLSLGLTFLFAISPFMVLYGRFAWNPNPLPFFLLLGFYSLLRSAESTEKNRGTWFVVSLASLGFATHLHFLAFVSLPIIVVIFLVWKRLRFSWKTWAAAMLVLVLFYIPVMLNDVMTGGANVREFISAVGGKSNKENHTLIEQVVRNVTNHATGFWTVMTGYEPVELPTIRQDGLLSFDIRCDEDCRSHLVSGFFSFLLFVFGFAYLVHALFTEKSQSRKDALVLSALWLGVSLALFTPLSYDFSPRFFLLIAPFPFVFLGFVAHPLVSNPRRRKVVLGWMLLVSTAVADGYFVADRLEQLPRASVENFNTSTDHILKEKTRVTLEQQEAIVGYMSSFYHHNGHPVYMYGEPQYRRAVKYLTERHNIPIDGWSLGTLYAQGNYFLIYRSGSDHDERLKKYLEKCTILEKKSFGTLTVFRLAPKPEAVTAIQPKLIKVNSANSASSVPERFTWKEWWEKQGVVSDDSDDDEKNVE